MLLAAGCCDTASVIREAAEHSLDPAMLYESVIELANEGLMTAVGINAAANVLLTQLGLPAYFFRNISKDSLKRLLRTIAGNIALQDGTVILRGEVSEAQLAVAGGVQARVATAENRDRMEAALNAVMSGYRVEYYASREYGYYTYIIHPEVCPTLEEMTEHDSPFAFVQDPTVPASTRRRYEAFLRQCRKSVVPLVDVTPAPESAETRLMFRDDFSKSALPVIRRMLEDLGICLNRAYWETYRGPTNRVESICSLYVAGTPASDVMARAVCRLHAVLALGSSELDGMYVAGQVSFEEYVFATLAAAFVHNFIHKGLATDLDIMAGLQRKDLRDALAKRVFFSNRAEYTREWVYSTIRRAPELIRWLYRLFDRKFNPRHKRRLSATALERELRAFRQQAAITFVDDTTGHDIFAYMTQIVSRARKTNFYITRKRSFALRLDREILDPLVFQGPVHGIFFVSGFYATATHMRAADVARGGLRLIRVTPTNYEDVLDEMPLLNYALGPVAQRLKHKDIAESGAKGVIVPRPEFAPDGLNAVYDLTEGIMDLMQPSPDVVDYLGQPEMIFFGPDEGTAGFMDAIAERGRERGYKYWRTLTTGKTIGIPHDTYGLTRDGRVFGLVSRGEQGTEFQLDCEPVLITSDTTAIVAGLRGQVEASGMTTIGVMACLRTVLEHIGLPEDKANLMMTGGPDGDLGANQIQSFRGRICLIVDGGAVLFDPAGLDHEELMKLAVARHTRPRLSSAAYPTAKLSREGFLIPRQPGRFELPDGTSVPDGAFFHRAFLTSPEVRRYVAAAGLNTFVPCGGLKDTINAANVRDFLTAFPDLRVIVEGANVFFDDTAREVIARETRVLHIKDSSANKGGVTSSSIAEVLTAFLLGERYEKVLSDPANRSALIRSVFDIIASNAVAETKMLLALHEQTGQPLYQLSVQTSEQLLGLQESLLGRLPAILADKALTEAVIAAYVPAVLREWLGMRRILTVLGQPALQAYRDAIVTKKLASMALYRHAGHWDEFLAELEADALGTLRGLLTSW
ncbi:MAG: NADP-specific glutamate dehydrogenase GdhA [Armatimonadetes bacterium]|nr:NADP-specific glutamate dehydrogenase GdhA [Armatimonadota bacterium]